MKKRLMLNFPAGIVSNPVTYNLIKRFDFVVNILQAQIFPEEDGCLIIELINDNKERFSEAICFLQEAGVKVNVISESVVHDEEKCMECSLCTGICRAGALVMDRENWGLEVIQEKCILCGICVEGCPVQALSLKEMSD